MPTTSAIKSRYSPQDPDTSSDWLLDVLHQYTRNGENIATACNLSAPPQIDSNILNRLTQKVNDIPPLPEIWSEVQDVLNNPESAPSDLGRIVQQDPILSAHLLRICNSSAYRTSGTKSITSVTMAIARLGMETAATFLMENAVLNAAGRDTVSKREVRHIWYHCLAISLICRILANDSKVITRSEIGLLGLLHDIGKMVILNVESESKQAELRTSIEDGIPELEAESRVLGYTHIEAGRILALRWKLPANVHHIISRHHHPCTYPPEQWPKDGMPAMILVHMAHIILQSVDQAYQLGGVWATSQRTHDANVTEVFHMLLQFDQNNSRIFPQIKKELDQLKLMFPDLFSDQKQE